MILKKVDTLVVIGGNAAGAAAASRLKKLNPAAEVILFEKSPFISTGTCEMPFYFSGEIKSPDQLVFFNAESFQREKGVKVYTGTEVLHIDRKRREVIYKGSNESTGSLPYSKVIIATGSKAVIPPAFEGNFKNVFSLKSIGDLYGIHSYFSNKIPQKITVIGGGYIGLEVCDSLSVMHNDITLIEKEERILPQASPELSALLLEILKKKGINVITGAKEIRSFEAEGKIKKIKTGSLLTDTCFTILASGFRPETALASAAGLITGASGGIKTDLFQRTNDSDISAAGDCTEYREFITNRSMLYFSATASYKSGHSAAENISGLKRQIGGMVKNLSFRFFDNYAGLAGISEKEAIENGFVTDTVTVVADNLPKVMPESRKTFGKIIYRKSDKMILGAEFIGGKEISGYLDTVSVMIKNRIPAVRLSEMDFNYTPSLSPFINLLTIAGKKIK